MSQHDQYHTVLVSSSSHPDDRTRCTKRVFRAPAHPSLPCADYQGPVASNRALVAKQPGFRSGARSIATAPAARRTARSYAPDLLLACLPCTPGSVKHASGGDQGHVPRCTLRRSRGHWQPIQRAHHPPKPTGKPPGTLPTPPRIKGSPSRSSTVVFHHARSRSSASSSRPTRAHPKPAFASYPPSLHTCHVLARRTPPAALFGSKTFCRPKPCERAPTASRKPFRAFRKNFWLRAPTAIRRSPRQKGSGRRFFFVFLFFRFFVPPTTPALR